MNSTCFLPNSACCWSCCTQSLLLAASLQQPAVMSYKEVNKEEALALLRRPGSEGGITHRDSPRSSAAGQQQHQASEALHVTGAATEEEHSSRSKTLLTTPHVKQSLLPAVIYGELRADAQQMPTTDNKKQVASQISTN